MLYISFVYDLFHIPICLWSAVYTCAFNFETLTMKNSNEQKEKEIYQGLFEIRVNFLLFLRPSLTPFRK